MTIPDPNPCGPDSWKSELPGWAHAPQFVFRSSCAAHDAAYAAGGTPADRLAADRQFRASMLAAIADRPPLTRVWLRWWAWVYYRAVRWQGAAHFTFRPPGAIA